MARRAPGIVARGLLAVLALAAAAVEAQELPTGTPIAAVEIDSGWDELVPAARLAVTLRPGDQYSVAAMRETLQNLYALGTIADVRVHARRGPEGLRLRLELEPQRLLWDVEFTGSRPWKGSRLRDALSLREGMVLDARTAATQAERLRAALADDGYLLAVVTPEIRTGDAPDRGILVLRIQPGSLGRLASVAVKSEEGISSTVLRAALEIPEGGPYRPAEFEQGLERIRARLLRGNYFFHDIRVTDQALDLSDVSMTLEIEVQTGPRVDLDLASVPFDRQELQERLAIFEFGTVEDWALKDSRHTLVRWLQERGHWRPLVSYHRQRDAAGRNVEVSFRVLAGDRAQLSRIDFEGNVSLEDARLLDVIRSRPSAFLDRERFISEWWEEDLRAVLTAYHRAGFTAATVTDGGVERLDGGSSLVATAVIEEGPRKLVRRVDVVVEDAAGAATIQPDLWRGALQLRAGGPFDRSAVRRDADRLRAVLSNAGFPRAVVLSEVDAGGDSAVVTYSVYPGERQRVSRVMIAGNRATRDHVIERELAFLPGSPFSFTDLLDTQSRLYSTGLFSQVDVTPTRPDDLDANQPLVVRVQEAAPLFITYGAGYDTEERLRGTFTIGHNNIRGRNQQLSFSTRASLREQRFRLLFTEPYFLGRRQEATATAFYTNEDQSSFSTQRFGASGQLLFVHTAALASLPRVFFRDTNTYDIEIDPILIRPEDQSTRVGGVSYSFIVDTRADPVEPSDGFYSTMDAEFATRVLGSNTNFVTLFGRWFGYRPLSDRITLALAGRVGFKIPYGDSSTIPLPERFFAGGSTTLRGFPLDGAGPVDANGNPVGGRVLLIANGELRARVWGALGGVLFTDIGNVFALPSTIDWRQVRETVGIGLRYATPVGPIRLDFARLMDRRPGEDEFQLFFSVGHTY